jgi:hypothetical protein
VCSEVTHEVFGQPGSYFVAEVVVRGSDVDFHDPAA